MSNLKDITGMRYGRLLVIGRALTINRKTRWNVLCDCGTEKSVGGNNLTTKHANRRIVSCGCYHKEVVSRIDAVSRNPAYLLYWEAKKRAKKKGFDFTIQPNDVLIPTYCPLLNVPLARGVGVLGPNSPSLDRINPQIGYVPGNVWVISHRANAIKSDASLEEMRTLIAAWELKCAT